MAPRRSRWLILLQNSYIAKGFAQDCEELIDKCKKVGGPLTYKVFCELWIAMNFASMYNKRTSGPEIAELSEEVVHIAKTFLTASTSNFEESVAALFLVYAIINLQPYERFAALRMTPEDVDAIHRIEMMARRERRFDVLYILGSVLIKGPTEYHADERERGCDRTVLKYLHGYGDSEANTGPRGVFYRQNTELDLLKEINSLSKQYAKAKKRVIVPGPKKQDPSLSYTEENFASQLESSLSKLVRGRAVGVDKKKEAEPEPEHYDQVQAIKRRAMTNKTKAVKHIVSVCDNLPDYESTNRQKADIRETSGKIKSNSPKKPITTGTPRKQIPPAKKKKLRRRRKNKTEISDDSTSEDDHFSLQSDDEYSDEADDLDLENFTRGKNLDEQIANEERELNEAVDRMPLRKKAKKLFEIEIEGTPMNANKNPKIEPINISTAVNSSKRSLRSPTKPVANVKKETEKKNTNKKKDSTFKDKQSRDKKSEITTLKSTKSKSTKYDDKETSNSKTSENEPKKRATRSNECETQEKKSPDGSATRRRKCLKNENPQVSAKIKKKN